ncbi:uncharacterized protein LOC142336004 isoform X2 [Convolutriloba macropyga]|uniref:uncharacterized protein LOC142336004 isoform X2 n=1 Tax=Convolutriloba macropyga TaxID=536237 RepID=UPI003F51ECD7
MAPLMEGEIEELYGEFCQIDKKETGTIPVDRMTQLMSSATNTKDWTEESVKQLLEECDVTPCEEYEFEDFLHILTIYRTKENNNKLISKLKEADTDHKGFLSPAILEEKMRELDKSFDEDDIKYWVDETSVNEAGEVNYEKFLENYTK